MAMTTNAILDFAETVDMARNPETKQWQAVMDRDSSQDGKFVFAVSSTGIYCRPSCPARRPRRENVTFFNTPDRAEKAGYRACLRCRPKAMGNAQSANPSAATSSAISMNSSRSRSWAKNFTRVRFICSALSRQLWELHRVPTLTPAAWINSRKICALDTP
jgi:AraC family transcriptional regulator of adaptative response/methylated-DNA-[protein]-cysteine methyltransferase